MKTTSTPFWSVIGLTLTAVITPLCAQPSDAPPPPRDHEEIRRQLQDLPPEERRARVRELREQWAVQSNDQRAGRRPTPGDFPPGERPQFRGPQPGSQGRFAPIFERVLNDNQRASFREAMEAQRDKLRELDEKLRAARKEALEASVAEKFKEKSVRQKAMVVAKLEAEMSVLRARALSQVKPPLSVDQIERLKNPPPVDGGAPPRPQFRDDEFRRGDRPERGPRDGQNTPRPRAE
jgi:uncharacterized membrane protein